MLGAIIRFFCNATGHPGKVHQTYGRDWQHGRIIHSWWCNRCNAPAVTSQEVPRAWGS